jgi:hypothetical protein
MELRPREQAGVRLQHFLHAHATLDVIDYDLDDLHVRVVDPRSPTLIKHDVR